MIVTKLLKPSAGLFVVFMLVDKYSYSTTHYTVHYTFTHYNVILTTHWCYVYVILALSYFILKRITHHLLWIVWWITCVSKRNIKHKWNGIRLWLLVFRCVCLVRVVLEKGLFYGNSDILQPLDSTCKV